MHTQAVTGDLMSKAFAHHQHFANPLGVYNNAISRLRHDIALLQTEAESVNSMLTDTPWPSTRAMTF